MRQIARVAGSVFLESVRDRVLYSLVVFAVLLIAASYLLAQLTAGQDLKIIKDLGLAAIATFGLFIAVFIGVGLVWKEVERRSIYSLLAKPLRRREFVLGKYAGLALTLAVNVATMTAAFYAVLAVMAWLADDAVRGAWAAPALDPAMLLAIALILMELLVVTAVALFFSTFSSPFLSAALTLGVWVVGRFGDDLRHFDAVMEAPAVVALARLLYYVLPNFAAFDIKAQVVHGVPVDPVYVGITLLYGAVYVGVSLVAAVIVFDRRDFR